MSANIPEHMLLSDLLKTTGYNCPSNLQGMTFKEATAGDQPAKLYAFGTAEAVIYTLSIPSSPSRVSVYVPAVTGLSKELVRTARVRIQSELRLPKIILGMKQVT